MSNPKCLKSVLEDIALEISKTYSIMIRSAGFHRANISNITSRTFPVTSEMIERLFVNEIFRHPDPTNAMSRIYVAIEEGDYTFGIPLNKTRASTKKRLSNSFLETFHHQGVATELFDYRHRVITAPSLNFRDSRREFLTAVFDGFKYGDGVSGRVSILKGLSLPDPKEDSVNDVILDYLNMSGNSHEGLKRKIGGYPSYKKRRINTSVTYVAFVILLVEQFTKESQFSPTVNYTSFIDRLLAVLGNGLTRVVLGELTVVTKSGETLDYNELYSKYLSTEGEYPTNYRTTLTPKQVRATVKFIRNEFSNNVSKTRPDEKDIYECVKGIACPRELGLKLKEMYGLG